jgi:hypothetical protein
VNMRCACPFCGGRIPEPPRIYIRCMHCTKEFLWFKNKAFHSPDEFEKYLATRFVEKQPLDGVSWQSKAWWLAACYVKALRSTPDRAARAKARVAAGWRKIAEIASSLVAFMSPGSVRFLSPGAAKILVQLTNENHALELNRLADLGEKTARELAEHRGPLHLNGITSLTAETARALSHHASHLYLNGITNLTDDALACISEHPGPLHMMRLTSTTAAADLLSTRQGELHVSKTFKARVEAVINLKKIVIEGPVHGIASSDQKPAKPKTAPVGPRELTPELAQKFILEPKGSLTLDDFSKLSPTAALILATWRGELSLCGLRHVLPLVASALARHVGNLKLNGLETLTAECAEDLARHDGDIEFDGLSELLPDVAGALAEHRHRMSLGGVRVLLPDAAVELARFRGAELVLSGLVGATPEILTLLRQNPLIRLPSQI